MYPNLQDTGALHMQIMQRTKDTAEVRFIHVDVHEAPPKWELKEYYGIFCFGQ